jgi:hypothetical protein
MASSRLFAGAGDCVAKCDENAGSGWKYSGNLANFARLAPLCSNRGTMAKSLNLYGVKVLAWLLHFHGVLLEVRSPLAIEAAG